MTLLFFCRLRDTRLKNPFIVFFLPLESQYFAFVVMIVAIEYRRGRIGLRISVVTETFSLLTFFKGRVFYAILTS